MLSLILGWFSERIQILKQLHAPDGSFRFVSGISGLAPKSKSTERFFDLLSLGKQHWNMLLMEVPPLLLGENKPVSEDAEIFVISEAIVETVSSALLPLAASIVGVLGVIMLVVYETDLL